MKSPLARVLPSPGGRRTSRPPLTRAAASALVLLLGAGALGGCTLHVATSPGELPQLQGVALVRDRAARTESAAATRAAGLAGLATQCEECRTALEAVAGDSRARLSALGGVWEPWGGATPAGAEAPAPVADAPMDPSVFASWLAASARRDLDAVAGDTRIQGSDARLLASAAVGRLESARRLAGAYGVALDAGDADLGRLLSRLSTVLAASSPQGDGSGGWSLGDPGAQSGSAVGTPDVGTPAGASPSPSPFPSENAAVQDSDVLAAAVRAWDCVAQDLPRAQVVDAELGDATRRADVLLTRATQALDAGVADSRVTRCRLGSSDLAHLDSVLLGADLDLLTSQSQTVRALGARYAREDVLGVVGTADPGLGPLPGTSGR